MKSKLIFILTLTMFYCCSDDKQLEDNKTLTLLGNDYLIFGSFYGYCGGERCVETFKLTATELFEDSLDKYSFGSDYATNFILMPNNKFLLAQNITANFPLNLLSENNKTFGMPDAYDQGGIRIQFNINGSQKLFYFDNDLKNVPQQYHVFLNKVKEKIQLLQ